MAASPMPMPMSIFPLPPTTHRDLQSPCASRLQAEIGPTVKSPPSLKVTTGQLRDRGQIGSLATQLIDPYQLFHHLIPPTNDCPVSQLLISAATPAQLVVRAKPRERLRLRLRLRPLPQVPRRQTPRSAGMLWDKPRKFGCTCVYVCVRVRIRLD